MSVSEAAKTENRLKSLIELRNLLAERLDAGPHDRDLAPLARQFVKVTAEIEAIRAEEAEKVASLADFRNKLKVV